MTPAHLLAAFLTLGTATGLADSAQAQAAPLEGGATARLVQCRAIADGAARLACYDSAVAAFETARAEGSVVVLSRDEVEETRRRSFGFDLNVLNPFDRADRPVELDSIETTLTSTRTVAGGKLLFTLADGSTWLQIDSSSPYVPRGQNQPIRVRRASLGSYMLNVDGGPPIRVRRQSR